MKLEIVPVADVEPVDGHVMGHPTTGGVTSRRASPADYPLWLARVELDDGATLRWPASHGDEGVYVRAGELEVAGTRCPAGGAVVVETGAACTVRAVGPTSLVHCGPSDGQGAGGDSVHVVGPEGRWLTSRGEVVSARWFADGTCPTCSIQLFHVRHAGQGTEQRGPSHHHSQDEIIHVLEGGMRLGSQRCGPDTSLCIPADVRYATIGPPGGHAFLNYRRDVSYLTADRAAPAALETAVGQGGVDSGGLRLSVRQPSS
ncbi:MAG: hypothetical protein AB7L84_00670 [Acidimicrobiia bacterium]